MKQAAVLSAGAVPGEKAGPAPRPRPLGQLSGKALERLMQLVFTLCGLVAVGFVLLITVYLILSGIPAIRQIGLLDFLFGRTWAAGQDQYGILPLILTSVYGTAGAIVLGVPVGFFTAVFQAVFSLFQPV